MVKREIRDVIRRRRFERSPWCYELVPLLTEKRPVSLAIDRWVDGQRAGRTLFIGRQELEALAEMVDQLLRVDAARAAEEEEYA